MSLREQTARAQAVAEDVQALRVKVPHADPANAARLLDALRAAEHGISRLRWAIDHLQANRPQ